MSIPYLNRYRNGEYLQYMNDALKIVNDQDSDALVLTEKVTALTSLIVNMESIYKQSLGSELTKEIQALDDRRDTAIKGIQLIAQAYSNHFDAQKVAAANVLLQLFNSYGENITRRNYQEESAVVKSLIGDFETKTKITAAISTLNISDWVDELKVANTTFMNTYVARIKEAAANPSTSLVNHRIEATKAYQELVDLIRAHMILSNNELYGVIYNELVTLAKNYNQVLENRSTNSTTNTEPTSETD